jgi:stage V sporulation protein B
MYGSTKGTTFILLMAPFFILNYYQGPLQAALQALNLARAAMINSFIGAAVKTAVILVLASRPEFGIYGVAIALIVGFVLVTMLHFATITKSIGFSIYVKDYAKMLAVIFLAGYVGTFLVKLNWTDSLVLMVAADTIIISLLYLILLFAFKLIKKEDIIRIPWIGPILTAK